MELMESCHLKELPDLSNATKLERLDLTWCQSLTEIPSSFSNLHKLKWLAMFSCTKLQVIPNLMNLASLEFIDMAGCSKLRKFPDFSTKIISLKLSNTKIEEVPASIKDWSDLRALELSCNGNFKTLSNLPESLTHLDLSYSGIEKISDCIKGVHALQHLNLSACRKLRSLPELPTQIMFISGRNVPAEFDRRSKGNSLTFHHPTFTRIKVCLVISPNHQIREYRVSQIVCRRIRKRELDLTIDDVIKVYRIPKFRTEHLFIFHIDCVEEEDKNISEIVFEFSSKLQDFDIIECGVQIWNDEIDRNIEGNYDSEHSEYESESDNMNCSDEKQTDCWSWLILCFDLSALVRSLVWGRRR